jgi:malonyl-CoA O-methyltransferase
MSNIIKENFSQVAENFETANFLHREVGQRLIERLEWIKLTPKTILDLGCSTGFFTQALANKYPDANILGLDLAYPMVHAAQQRVIQDKTFFMNGDADRLPFKDHSVDFIFSALVLPWCPDLEKTFKELHRVLAPNGLLLFAIYGPDTLIELRSSWASIDELRHVNDFHDMHDVGDMLVQSRFADPVVDMEIITLHYSNVLDLLREIKMVGTNYVKAGKRQTLTGKQRFQIMLDTYATNFRTDNNKIPATYEIVYGTTWGTGSQNTHGLDESGIARIPISHIQGLRGRRG